MTYCTQCGCQIMPCMTFFSREELGRHGQICFACGATGQLERLVELHEQMDEDIAELQANRRELRKAINEHPARKILNPKKRRKLDELVNSWWGY